MRGGTLWNQNIFEDLISLCADISNQENKLLPLCAAENVASPFSKIPLDTFLQEKYIMGGVMEYQNHSNFVGKQKAIQNIWIVISTMQ